MIATVYGRFHYVLDTLAGAALAIAVVAGYRYLFGDGPGERQSASSVRSEVRHQIRRAGHPASRRSPRSAYTPYARSSRLAIRAPRPGLWQRTSDPGR